jgi:hypothetical protein
LGQDLKLAPIVLAAILATLLACRHRAGVKMLTEKFEPYGEPLPEFRSGKREQPKATSAILSVVGQYSFWLLVVVIVSTRVAFFSPVPSFSTQAFANHSLLAWINSAPR